MKQPDKLSVSIDTILRICDSMYRIGLKDAMRIIGERLAQSSKDTGHGKAQRAFAHDVLSKISAEIIENHP